MGLEKVNVVYVNDKIPELVQIHVNRNMLD